MPELLANYFTETCGIDPLEYEAWPEEKKEKIVGDILSDKELDESTFNLTTEEGELIRDLALAHYKQEFALKYSEKPVSDNTETPQIAEPANLASWLYQLLFGNTKTP